MHAPADRGKPSGPLARRVRVKYGWLWIALWLGSCGHGAASSPGRLDESAGQETAGLRWSEWGRAAFERARDENKPILLSVQAGWCHWCHVMNETTFRDPEVVRRLNEHFVLVRADGDARPDLAARYRRYAWPATVFLSPDGAQILGLRGYRAPDRFRGILQEVLRAHGEGHTIDERSVAEPTNADLDAVRTSLTAQLDSMYQPDGGWGRRQRYPFAAPVQHAFYRAAVHGQDAWRDRALLSLERYARLIDPEWGGMYQYSVRGDWDHPHYEKIVPVQAGAIREFAEAYRVSGDPGWLQHADSIHRYVREFLRAPDGAFYVSQDADLRGEGEGPSTPGDEFFALDDAARRARGIPRVDTHIYAATNGLLIEALAELHVASGRQAPLAEASRAADRITRTHRAASGLFRHDAESDDPLFYLTDQAHMLAAFVALHQASAQGRWLEEATRLADATIEALRDDDGAFVAHTEDPRAEGFFDSAPVPILAGGVLARALIAVARLADEPRYREVAVEALSAAAQPAELRSLGRMVGEFLLALEAARDGFVVLSVVGPESPETGALHRAALQLYDPTRLVELGRPGHSRYPYPGQPAVFLCTHVACSMPVFEPDALASSVGSFLDR